MTDFKEGQRVHVEYDAVVADFNHSGRNVMQVEASFGGVKYYPLAPKSGATLLAPEGWPPQVGDVWKIRASDLAYSAEVEYAVRAWRLHAGHMVAERLDANEVGRHVYLLPDDLDDFKALDPRLVRRREPEEGHPA